MKNLIKNVFIVLSCITLFLSCSKGDDTPTDNPVGGDAFRSQVMTIDLPNTSLLNSEYHGSMGNTTITLTKGDEHKLLFMVPSTMTVGNQDLVINDLNNMKITYNVKEIVLPNTPDAIISEFQNNLTIFQATASGNISTQKAIDSFNQVYSNATEEEKSTMATLYYVNKSIFNDIILNDYTNVSGKNNAFAMNKLIQHKLATLVLGSGVIVLYSSPTPIEKVFAAALITIGTYKSLDYWIAFAEMKINTLNLLINNVFGTNNKLDSAIQLQNNVSQNLTFNTNDRTVISSDSNKQNSGFQLCFLYHNMYNNIAQVTNSAIQWINSNVPFANFDLITLETVPTTSESINSPIDSTVYSNLTLSINDSNLSLISSSLSATGQLRLKVKINGTATTVNSNLNYTFSDEFSTFSGSFPITVIVDNTETVTIGTQVWMLKNLGVDHYRNGDPIPQVTDPTQWANLTTGAWCYYNNDSANGTVYGKLYNWYAVNDPRGLAPTGYHVPSDAEWTILTDFLGGESVAGGKMKSTGTSFWQIPNTGATNESGFTGLPAGVRGNNGAFDFSGTSAYWWSSSLAWEPYAWGYSLNTNSGSSYRVDNENKIGISVRCIKD